MSSEFDPYYKWLAIPPAEQPPNHYRLLGVALFEPDADVIESAADQRMAHIRGFQTGKHAADSQRLLNELAAARRCLFSSDRRAAYDQELRAERARRTTPARAPVAMPLRVALPVKALPVADASSIQGLAEAASFPLEVPAIQRRRPTQHRTANIRALVAVLAVAFLALGGLAWLYTIKGGQSVPADAGPGQARVIDSVVDVPSQAVSRPGDIATTVPSSADDPTAEHDQQPLPEIEADGLDSDDQTLAEDKPPATGGLASIPRTAVSGDANPSGPGSPGPEGFDSAMSENSSTGGHDDDPTDQTRDGKTNKKTGPATSKAEKRTAAEPLVVLEARWGAGNRWADVESALNSRVRKTCLVFSNPIFTLSDPAPGEQKTIRLKYRIGKRVMYAECAHDDLVSLGRGAPPPKAHRGLTVVEACWGVGIAWADVTVQLRARVVDNKTEGRADDWPGFVDPQPGVRKWLYVRYWVDGEERFARFHDGDHYALP